MVRPFAHALMTTSLIQCPRLIGVNAVSLVAALLANLALLLNMGQRLSFKIAQPITTVGFFIASIILIVLVAIAAHHFHEPGVADQALTQAYYYAIWAAALYWIIASLMLLTIYGAYAGHYSKDFKLTMSQRTLMLQTIAFMVYLLGGAAVYAHIEGWKFLDAVYWADFTLLTIGIGDYAPSTHLGRALLFPYAIGGIVILGLVVGSIRSLVLERGKKKMGARMTEKTRKAVVKRIQKSGGRKGQLKLEPIDSEGSNMSEWERRQLEFEMMRKVQDMATAQRKWMSLLISGSAWFILWFIGAVVFWQAEKNQNWTYFESLYFAYTTLLTIGYGDFRPYSNSGKPFFVFWSLLAIPTLTILISNMGDTVVKAISDLTIYLGEVTVLPGEHGPIDRMKYGLKKITAGRIAFDVGDVVEHPPGLVQTPKDSSKRHDGPAQNHDVERVAGTLEKGELEEADEARERGDFFMEDEHHYRYLLIKEIRNVYEHLNAEPPRKYTFEEWAYYLKLLGEDEASPEFHRKAPWNVETTDHRDPDMGTAGEKDGNEAVRQWSWMGNRSPLMGEKEEAEWLLERLTLTLEEDLNQQRTENRRRRQMQGQEEKSRGADFKQTPSSGTLEDQQQEDRRVSE